MLVHLASFLVPIPVQSWDQGRSGSMGVTPPSSQRPEGHIRNVYFSVSFSLLNFIYIFILALLDLRCSTGLSHVAENGGYFLVRVPRLLTAVASLDHWLQGAGA